MAFWNRPILLLAALALPVALPARAQPTCERLSSLHLPGVTITLAQTVAAGSFTPPAARAAVNVPAFCRVAGVITPEVHFELWMPAAWNKKLLTAGNGGLAGTINYNAMLDPLRRGYASSSTEGSKWQRRGSLRMPSFIPSMASQALYTASPMVCSFVAGM